jgi:hypothetical protein
MRCWDKTIPTSIITKDVASKNIVGEAYSFVNLDSETTLWTQILHLNFTKKEQPRRGVLFVGQGIWFNNQAP